MKPLSIWKYFNNNKKKLIPIFIAIFLSVFLIYVIRMLFFSLDESTYGAWVKPKEYFSLALPASEDRPIEAELINGLKNLKGVKKVLPVIMQSTKIVNIFGGNSDTYVLGVQQDSMEYIISHMDLKLKEGRLPEKGTKEIIMHWRILANKKLKIGDVVGSNIDNKELLKGEYTIVGALEGPPVVSFTSLEAALNSNNVSEDKLMQNGTVLLYNRNMLEEVNDYLDTIKPYQAYLSTYNTGNGNYHRTLDMLSLTLDIIEIMIISILSISVGLICYIYFYQRRNEFGILNALGYTQSAIIKRALLETCGISFIGFLFGILASISFGVLLNNLVYSSKGLPLELFQLEFVYRTLTIPIFITLFSSVPIWRMLNRLNPIEIIEGMI